MPPGRRKVGSPRPRLPVATLGGGVNEGAGVGTDGGERRWHGAQRSGQVYLGRLERGRRRPPQDARASARATAVSARGVEEPPPPPRRARRAANNLSNVGPFFFLPTPAKGEWPAAAGGRAAGARRAPAYGAGPGAVPRTRPRRAGQRAAAHLVREAPVAPLPPFAGRGTPWRRQRAVPGATLPPKTLGGRFPRRWEQKRG